MSETREKHRGFDKVELVSTLSFLFPVYILCVTYIMRKEAVKSELNFMAYKLWLQSLRERKKKERVRGMLLMRNEQQNHKTRKKQGGNHSPDR